MSEKRSLLSCIIFSLAAGGCTVVETVRLAVPAEIRYKDHTAEEHMDFGVVYEEMGDLRRARRQYRWSVRRDPGNPIAHANLGNVQYRRGRWRAAESAYERAVDLDEGYLPAINNLAYIYVKHRQQPDRAVALLEPFVSEDTGEYRDFILATLILAHDAKGDKERADALRRIAAQPAH